jgi:hypothetical protein
LLVSTGAAGLFLVRRNESSALPNGRALRKNAGPAKGKRNRRAEIQDGEEEKCETII